MKRLFIIITVALGVYSCSKEQSGGTEGGDMVAFSPCVTIGAEANSSTRAIVDGSNYLPIRDYSMGFEAIDDSGVRDDVNTAFYDSYGCDYISAVRQDYDKAWGYKYRQNATSYTHITLFKSKGKVRLYAVRPNNSAFRPTQDYLSAIPFTIGQSHSSNHDYMYTGAVVVDPTVAADRIKTLNFSHVMAALEFKVTNTMVGSVFLKTITIEATKDGNPKDIFLMDGTFSGYDGTITPGTTRQSKLVMQYNTGIVYKHKEEGVFLYTSCGVIVPEIDQAMAEGVKLDVTFEFDYKNSDEDDDGEMVGKGGSFTLNLDDIKTNSIAQGLLTGYRYTYIIEIDNFIKYTDYPEVAPWKDEQIGGSNVVHEIIF